MRYPRFLLFLVPIALPACMMPTASPPASAPSVPSASSEMVVPSTVRQDPWKQRLVNPVSRPWYFESPSIQSEIRPIFMTQEMPGRSLFRGGDFQLYALQARWAVNDKFAIIATKDGYIEFDPDMAANQDGFADVAAGVKYKLWEDTDSGMVLTPGLIYEVDVGDHDVFQGNGDGLFRGFVSGGWDLDECNVVCVVGYNLPINGAQESHSLDYHAHFSYEVTEQFFPAVEINGVTYTRNGNLRIAGTRVNFEGDDLINLGSAGVAGQTVMTLAVGARYRFSDTMSVGAAWEYPITSRKDLLQSRVTVDFVLNW
jgi:hypothetical protein